jgi:hypothetical protein
MYYSGIRLVGLSKTTKNLSQLVSGLGFEPGPEGAVYWHHSLLITDMQS